MSRAPLRSISGTAVSLMRSNVDTDLIIRVERMTSIDPSALARWAFEAIRYDVDGRPLLDFPFNRTDDTGATILVTGANFGCGSSREPAVWAIQGLGIGCVVAPSFGQIFRGNCFQNGVLPIELPERDVLVLAAIADRRLPIVIDLERQTIESAGCTWGFSIPVLQRRLLLDGLDTYGLAISERETIAAWQTADRVRRPWAWPELSN